MKMPRLRRNPPGQLSFTVTVSLKVGVVSLTTAALIILIFYLVYGKIDKDFFTFSITTIGVAAAVTSAFYVGSSITETVLARKEDRAIALITIWNSEYYATLRKKALRTIKDLIKDVTLEDQPNKINERLQQDSQLEEDVITILNFLEEVAACVNKDLVDNDLTESYFGYIIPRLAFIFGTWMLPRRNARSSSLYEELCILGERWKDNLKK